MSTPLEVFCCYAREDREMLEHLKKHLKPLQRQGQVMIWSDTNLNAGVEWEKELHQHLESADIILLLISPHFMASDYCYSTEMGRAIARHNEGSAWVIPILLRSTFWQNAPFAKLQIIPTNAKPVTSWPDRDEAYHDITIQIKQVVSELQISAFDPAKLTLLRTLKGRTDSAHVRSTAWSPDGKQIASGSVDGTVHLWDWTEGVLPRTLKDHEGKGHKGPVSSVAWSPDNKRLASSSYDGTVRLWDAATGELLRTLKEHEKQVCSVAWSPDGERLASGAHDKTIRLWDATTGELLRTLEGHLHAVRSVGWSPDGERLASGANDKTVRLWDATTGELLRTLKGHKDFIRLVAWSPDGKQIASGSHDETIRLWDAATGELLRTLKEHEKQVCSVAWFPKGPLLASVACDDNPSPINTEVYFWHTNTWKSLPAFKDRTGFMHSSWHPVSPCLATVGKQEGDIDIWQLDLKNRVSR